MNKMVKIFMFSTFLSLLFAFTAFADWEADGSNWRYNFGDGSYARDQIIVIDGASYKFDGTGLMNKGWSQDHSGTWYYSDPNSGALIKGWLQDKGVWYYLTPKMSTGWQRIDNKLYYFDGSGGMKCNTLFSTGGDGQQYYADESGVVKESGTMRREIGGVESILKFTSGGQIYYKSANSQLADREQWWPLLEGQAQQENIRQQQDEARIRAEDIKGELVELYYDQVYGSGYKTSRTQKWEEKVTSKLTQYNISTVEINEFIRNVKNGRYKDGYEEEDASELYDYGDDYGLFDF